MSHVRLNDPVPLLSPRLLLVDDEQQIHASIRLRLGDTCNIVSCLDAPEALEKIRGHRFDLCLVDLNMPLLNGFAFIDAAQQIDPELGFVIISGFDSPENLRRAISLRVFDFLSKPLPAKAKFENLMPGWIERTRHRRRERQLANQAETIAVDLDSARLDREIELVASEAARDALRQTAGLLTTIHAHLLSATSQLALQPKADAAATRILLGLSEARKTAEAAMTVAEGFFDTAYGSRDASPALLHEGVRHAIGIATRMRPAEVTGPGVDCILPDTAPPLQGLSGIDLLLLLAPAISVALAQAPASSTVGLRGESVARLDQILRDPKRKGMLWFNRRHAAGSHPGILLTLSADAPPFSIAQAEAWLKGEYAPLAAITARGLVAGLKKSRGLLGFAIPPQASRFTMALALPA